MTNRSRRPRSSRALAALAVAALAAALGVSAAGAQSAPDVHPLVPSHRGNAPGLEYDTGVPRSAERPVDTTRARSIAEGGVLYATHCSTCHGIDFRGTANVPSLLHAGGAAVAFYMSTGRMPAPVPGIQEIHQSPHFDARQTAAIDAYVTSRALTSVAIPSVVTSPALLQRGRMLFENNCEMCHGAAAQGATVGRGWIALALDRASPAEIGEAIRIGPGVMPRWSAAVLSDGDIDALATYVRYVVTEPGTYGGLTFDYLGVVIEGVVAVFVGVFGLFWVIFYTGTKTSGDRLNEK